MWKDFFYFSKGQRIGIIVLISLILIVLAANYSLPLFFPVKETDGSAFLKEAENFKKSLVSRDSLRQADWESKYAERQQLYEEKYKKYHNYSLSKVFDNKPSYSLFLFDPNTADSTTFVRLGLKPFIASIILRYRKSGGMYRVPTDFSKTYGISAEKFKELESYIKIAELKTVKIENVIAKRSDIIVDLNSADTTLLMQVKGIGRGYAKGIVRFRQHTGGFVSVDQLGEIYGMKPESMERIRPFCKVNLDLVQKIKINTASVERLKTHPYINFYQAKALYELRRKKGKLKDFNELKVLTEFTSEALFKLKPYLSFE